MHSEIRRSVRNGEAGIGVAATTTTATTAVAEEAAGGDGRTVARRRRRIDGSVMRAKCDRRARRHEYPDTADRVAGDSGGGGEADEDRTGEAE